MALRKLPDWLDSYLEYTANQEPTDKLNFWVAVSLISAAIKRQVFMRRVRYKLYPNTYVMLVAESAKARKSIAMDTGVKLLKDAVPDLFYISGSMTPEGLVKHMNRQKSVIKDKGNDGKRIEVQLDSHVIIHMDEVAESFGYDRARASKFTILLTKIYGAQDEHTHTIASEDQILLRNLYPVVLAGTDPNNLKVIPDDAVAGLFGRLIFVAEKTKKRNIAWSNPEEDKAADALYEILKYDLHTISTLNGEMTPTDEAKAMFEMWYNELGNKKIDDPRVEGFRQRCHDTALKIAMVHSLSESNNLIISAGHVAKGIKQIELQLPEFNNLSQWSSANEYAQRRAKFIEYLRRQGGAGTRSQAMKMMTISLDEMIILEHSLEAEHTVEVSINGKYVFYKLSKEEQMK